MTVPRSHVGARSFPNDRLPVSPVSQFDSSLSYCRINRNRAANETPTITRRRSTRHPECNIENTECLRIYRDRNGGIYIREHERKLGRQGASQGDKEDKCSSMVRQVSLRVEILILCGQKRGRRRNEKSAGFEKTS